ncbi:MAG: YIP1 family protein [Elusimicrobiota bacterium]
MAATGFPQAAARPAAADGLSVFYDFIEAPELAAEEIRRRPPVAFGVLAYILGATSLFLAQALVGKGALLGLSWFSLGVACAWNLGTGLLLAAVIHLLAEAMGGAGRVMPLFVLLGFGELAWALILPGVLLLQAAAPGNPWALRGAFLLVGFLALVLKARGIRHNYGFSALRAWFVLIAPYFAVAASLVLVFAAALWAVAQQLLKALS